jgi:hypothetical protein
MAANEEIDQRMLDLIEKYQILQSEVYLDPDTFTKIANQYRLKIIEFLRAIEEASENYYGYLIGWLIERLELQGVDLRTVLVLNEIVNVITSGGIDVSDLRKSDRKIITQFLDDTWPEMLQQFGDLGYEFHYFNFFLRFHPLVRVWREEIELTPQNFEVGSDLVDLQQYEEALQAIQNFQLKRDDQGRLPPFSLREITPFRTKFLGGRALNQSDYKYHVDQYQPYNNPYYQTVGPTGWKKDDLRKAIRQTGLNNPIERITSDGDKVKHYQLSEMLGRDPTKKMWGFGNWSYFPKLYYETLYRKVFNTLINVDWVQVCRQNLARYDDLKNAAIEDFGLDRDTIEQLEYDQICDLLEQESKRRRSIREMLTSGIPKTQTDIVYQPGGTKMKQLYAEVAGLGLGAALPDEPKPISSQLQRLIGMCDDNDVTREQIFALAQEMDLEVLLARLSGSEQTKENYCRVLRNYLERM